MLLSAPTLCYHHHYWAMQLFSSCKVKTLYPLNISLSSFFPTSGKWITFFLSIHLLRDTWFPSTFWLLWIMLLWTWVCTYTEVELLDHMIIVFLTFLRNHYTVSVAVVPFYIPINSAQGLQFLHILINTCSFLCLIACL